MALYEHVFLARQDVTSQQVETMVDTYKGVIESNGGKVEKTEMWGVKSLAYRIKKNRKGHYMLLGLDCAPAVEQEVARQLGLNEDVLRHMTLRVEEITDEPSAILARRGEDRERDRGFRGPRPAGRFSSGRRDRDDREEFRARPRDEIEQPQGEE